MEGGDSMKILQKQKAITASVVGLMLLAVPKTVWAANIQQAIQSSSNAIFSNLDAFVAKLIKVATSLIPPVATLALLIGVLVAFVCTPLKKYRGFDLGCIAFSIILLLLYLFLPTIITMLTI